MEKANRPLLNWRDLFFAGIVIADIIADQLTKLWIRNTLLPGQTLHDYGLFRIVFWQNTGAAFGIFKDRTQILTIVDFIGIAALLIIFYGLRRRWPFIEKVPVVLSMGLILAGTIGNLIDRLWLGQVTDWIDFKLWPVFNIADASVSVGVVILAYCLIFLSDMFSSKK
ncbi:MAG TPA: signal peptidase II [Dehalococcoidales bacterium]|nr:signal peptidase II [Dehalococcoidales bacterium]